MKRFSIGGAYHYTINNLRQSLALMQSKFAIGRTIGLAIAIIGIMLSIYCVREAWRCNDEFKKWFTDRPMEMKVDLSKPGEMSVPFHQTCQTAHNEVILLKVDPPLGDKEIDFSAELVIVDESGKEVERQKLGVIPSHLSGIDDILVACFYPFKRGNYVATLHVESGAEQLAGKNQTLYARYLLCGIEKMPVMVMAVFSIGAGLIGLVAAVCCLPGLVRNGFWRTIEPRGDLSQSENGQNERSQSCPNNQVTDD